MKPTLRIHTECRSKSAVFRFTLRGQKPAETAAGSRCHPAVNVNGTDCRHDPTRARHGLCSWNKRQPNILTSMSNVHIIHAAGASVTRAGKRTPSWQHTHTHTHTLLCTAAVLNWLLECYTHVTAVRIIMSAVWELCVCVCECTNPDQYSQIWRACAVFLIIRNCIDDCYYRLLWFKSQNVFQTCVTQKPEVISSERWLGCSAVRDRATQTRNK